MRTCAAFILALALSACAEDTSSTIGDSSAAICGPSSVWCYVSSLRLDEAASATIRADEAGRAVLRLGSQSDTCSTDAAGPEVLIRWQAWPEARFYPLGSEMSATYIDGGSELAATTGDVRIDSVDEACIGGHFRFEFGAGAMAEGAFAALSCD